MKKLHLFSIMALLVLAFVSLSGCFFRINTGGKSSSNVVSDATLSTSVDSQSRPIDGTNVFTVATDLIYLSVKLNNAPSDTQVMAKLTYLEGEASNLAGSTIYSSSLNGQGNGYIAFSMKSPPGGYPQGSYKVAISANGQDQVTIPFTVQNMSVQKGWPVVNKFTSSKDTIPAGVAVTLSWDVSNAARITLQPEIGTIEASGTRSVTPSASTTYKIIASNDVGSTTRELTVNVGAAVSGAADLIITDTWLEGCMIYYKIKNIGTVDTVPTYTYLYVDNLLPPGGSSSFVDVLKPGQEAGMSFSSYQWPWCGAQPGGTITGAPAANHSSFNTLVAALPNHTSTGAATPVVDWSLMNHTVKVCADAKNQDTENDKTNNCIQKLWGTLVDYDLLPLAHLAAWKNSSGEVPAFGTEGSHSGAYIKMSDGGLEMVPEQVPQGWIQGYWGVFYTDTETHVAQVAAVKIPAKLHLIAKVGLASNATGTDGVTFKLGLKDMSDTMNFLPGKIVTVPGQYEVWDIDLSDYEGQKVLFVLRVEAGASPANDFAIWKEARLVQVQD
jgi:hypothetical protein